ncbi:mannonate dehydratase [Nakamurella lactea]|uniref:mannonate dehydratase n=1 Tax=Nakamurella lactea TaxID=459515 RepID=UPI000428EA7D|nr:mannonate dehydratase [Nakamurella lactea]
MRLSELLHSTPEPLWHLVKQCGVDHAVMILDGAEQESRWLRAADRPAPEVVDGDDVPWSESRLRTLQQQVAGYGMSIAAIEDTPPMDRIRLGLPGRDQDIDAVLVQIAAMGRLGIPVLCYNWMAITSWARTDVGVPLRGGALSSGFSQRAADRLPALAEPGEITGEQLWDALQYFLNAAVPAAEQAGVRLSLHPDDPPLPSMRGVPRIVSSIDAYRRVLALYPSPNNAITLCQGNFALMTDELPSVIREFGGQHAVAFVHFRDVRGTAADFIETFHDEGQNDLEACMRAYAEVGFDGPMRPDHVPTLFGESNERPGYATLGRLYALGYLRALQQVAYGRGQV